MTKIPATNYMAFSYEKEYLDGLNCQYKSNMLISPVVKGYKSVIQGIK